MVADANHRQSAEPIHRPSRRDQVHAEAVRNKTAMRRRRMVEKRAAKKIVAGIDFPTKAELRAMLATDSLPHIGRIAERHPGLRLTIDHLGGRGGTTTLKDDAAMEHMPALIRSMHAVGRGAFYRLYVRAYARARPIDDDLVDRWEVVRVADRVMEGIDAEQPGLLAQLERFADESA